VFASTELTFYDQPVSATLADAQDAVVSAIRQLDLDRIGKLVFLQSTGF